MKNKRLSENWKIFILSTIVLIIVLGITLSWPYIQNELWGKHPDTHIVVVGMDESPPPFTNITMKSIKYPSGVSNIDLWMPYRMFNWTYSNNSKYYMVVPQNKGDGTAKNVKIKINFNFASIQSINIHYDNRIKIIGGGITGSFVEFLIPELLPNERQEIDLMVNNKNFESISVWSEMEGDIKNIYIYDMVVEE